MSKISSGSLTVVDVKGGSDGINTATIYLYQRAATAPSKPSTNLTYTFATAKLTGGLGSWTQDIGTLTGSDPIWVIAAVASSNGAADVIEPTEWSEPIKMAQDGQPGAPGQPGAKGLNQATVFIYKRDDSAEKPNSVTYTFATGSFTVPTGWSTSIPQSNGKPCWVCSAVAIGSDATAQLSWTTPSVMVEDGSDGVSPVVTSTDNGVQIYDPVNDVTYTITNGADGTSYYTHILYSSKATPTSASDVSTSPTRKDYVGIQTTTSRTAPSWNDSGWQWMKYVGNDGTSVTVSSVKYAKSTTDSQPQDSSFNTALPTVGEGEWLWTMTTYSDGSKVYTKSKQGKSGTSVTVSKTEYQAGTSATTAPTGEWKTTIPSVAEGQYLWTKTTYSDGNYSYTVAKQGKSGTSITISSTSVKYQVGTSATTAPTGEWKDTVQSTTTGQYLWTRTIVTYSDGSETTSYSVSAHGATGTSVSISSIKYATSTTDSQPADSSFGTSIPTVSEGQWLWTMTTYSNGSKMYTKSKQGKSGVSVTKTRELYYLKTNSTNVPTITATSQITATDRENGWTSVVPTYAANGTYYTCIETSLSTGGPVWSTPVENQGLTDANANAAESLSVSTHANENAQGALSISRATQQHFWFVSENTGSGANLIEAGAYITDTPIDTFKNGKSGGYLLARSDGVELGRGMNKFMTLSATALNFYRPGTSTIDATLTSKGLVLSKGGIEAGIKNTTNYIYIYSDDDATNHKLTINSHEASDWRIIAGKNFGVDKAGNLYASGANIQGQVTITAGSNVYTKDEVDDAVGDTATDLANYILSNDKAIDDLERQIDGAIDTWYYAVDPTTSNEPAKDWTTEALKESHLRDLYFNTSNGHTWRWAKDGSTYKWIQIEDADAIKALADAAKAQTTANVKKRVFVTTPVPPYDVGDLWVGGSKGDIKKCKTAKAEGQSYAAADWELASKYTDDTNLNNYKTEVSNTYSTKVEVQQTESTLEGKITAAETSSKSYADGLIEQEVSDRNTAIQASADGITTSVSQNYTKTVDLANTDAVKAAKKAGTDAQSALNTYKTTNDAAVKAAKKAGNDAQADLDDYKDTVQETYATKTQLTQTESSIKTEVSSTYATKSSVPTKVSQLTNDSKYATQTQAQGYANTAESNAKADATTKANAAEANAKADATTKANAAEANAKADTTEKLKSYSTTTQMNSAIEQKAGEISLAAAQTAEQNAKDYADGLDAKARPFVRGTQTAKTDAWTGVCDELTELKDGQEILYFLPYAGSGNATLNLTLNDGTTTGAINCYYSSTSRLTTQFGAGMTIPLVYHKNFTIGSTNYTGWWTLSQYNSDTYDRKRISSAVKVAEDIPQYIIAGRSGAGHKKLAGGLVVDLTYPICYLNQGNASGKTYVVASGGTCTGFYTACPSVNLQNTKASWKGTNYSMCYIKGTLAGNSFTIHSDIFTTTVPTSDDGFVYIPIGMLYSDHQVDFACDNSLYGYRDNSFGPLALREASKLVSSAKAEIKVTTDGISSEVSKKTDKDSIISTIRQSAETVKIKASQVEIDGTATFNAIKSQTDAAYDAINSASAVQTSLEAAAVAEEQYIYISKASGTTSVSKTTTWVTETGDKQNTWTTKRPTYNISYPLLFVAKQKKVVNDTVTCTTPVKDDTTTIIDGGHITTGTIDSNRLNADTIKVNAANIQGSLTIGQLPSTVAETSDIPTKVSELTNDSGYQTSTQVSSAINEIRSWYATCSTAAGTAAKVATITPTTTAFTTSVLTAGTLVNVKFTVTNTAAVADLTLNINNTGAKHIKTLRYGVISNIAGTGYLAKDTTYQFTYDGTYWVMQENYDSNTTSQTRWQNVIAAAEAITNGHIICGTASGYRNIAANVSFDMDYPLLYAGTAIAKGATTGTRDNNFLEINSINASSNGTITSGAANKVLFLKGTLTNNTFKIAASPFMTTVAPTSEDNFCYIPLGIMYSATNIYFRSSDQLYAYKDGAFGPVSIREASAASKTATTYITRIDDNGIKVHAKNNVNSNYAKINASGMEVYKGGKSVAMYGDTARLGEATSARLTLGPEGLGLYDTNSVRYFNIESSVGATNTYVDRKITDASGGTGAVTTDLSSDASVADIWSNLATGAEFFIRIAWFYYNSSGVCIATKEGGDSFKKGTTKTSNSYVKYTKPNTLAFTASYPSVSGASTVSRMAHLEVEYSLFGPVYQFCNNPTSSNGAYCFMTGNGVQTNYDYQTAVGRYNNPDFVDDGPEDYRGLFFVGGGASDAYRKNAMVVTHSDDPDGYGSDILIGLDTDICNNDSDIAGYLSDLGWDLEVLIDE